MYLDRLFKLMAEKQASDLFISCGAPINIKINGVVSPISTQPMDVETVRRIAYELMSKEQAREFENELEMNLSYLDRAVGKSPYQHLPAADDLAGHPRAKPCVPVRGAELPSVLLNLVMEKRGRC
jgi:twitching motility protein PilU